MLPALANKTSSVSSSLKPPVNTPSNHIITPKPSTTTNTIKPLTTIKPDIPKKTTSSIFSTIPHPKPSTPPQKSSPAPTPSSSSSSITPVQPLSSSVSSPSSSLPPITSLVNDTGNYAYIRSDGSFNRTAVEEDIHGLIEHIRIYRETIKEMTGCAEEIKKMTNVSIDLMKTHTGLITSLVGEREAYLNDVKDTRKRTREKEEEIGNLTSSKVRLLSDSVVLLTKQNEMLHKVLLSYTNPEQSQDIQDIQNDTQEEVVVEAVEGGGEIEEEVEGVNNSDRIHEVNHTDINNQTFIPDQSHLHEVIRDGATPQPNSVIEVSESNSYKEDEQLLDFL